LNGKTTDIVLPSWVLKADSKYAQSQPKKSSLTNRQFQLKLQKMMVFKKCPSIYLGNFTGEIFKKSMIFNKNICKPQYRIKDCFMDGCV
jgi:hypothetical protein